MKTEDTEALGRELNQARSKPDTACHTVIRELLHSEDRDTSPNPGQAKKPCFPFLQTNIISQMWPSGGKWDCIHVTSPVLYASDNLLNRRNCTDRAVAATVQSTVTCSRH